MYSPEQPERPERPDPDQEQPSLPVGLRMVLYYLVIFTVIMLGTTVFLLLLVPQQEIQSGRENIDFGILLAVQVLLAPLVVAATRIFAQKVDDKPLTELGVVWPGDEPEDVRRATLWAVFGALFLVGSWLFLAWAFAEVRFGDEVGVEPTEGGGVLMAGLYAIGFLIAALMGELMFRGYIYTTLRERLPWIHAGGVTALLYTLLYGASPETTAAALCNIFLLGLMLAALRELSSSIWTGAVFHAVWNFSIACVLSLPLSGENVEGLFTTRVAGLEIFTGGDYGPEGSWLLTAPLVVMVMLLTWRLDPLMEAEVGEEDEQDPE